MKSESQSRMKPVLAALVAVSIACGLVGAGLLWPAQLRSVAIPLKLPADLAKYKGWRTLIDSPTPVPLELWIRCTTSTPADWNQARKKYGPHTEHYIQIYGNHIATKSLPQGKAVVFPIGAVIAKEKIVDSPDGAVAGVAFMIKRGTHQFATTGGWEFAYYPRSGDSARLEACATCHASVASKDYVFGQYPSSGDPLRPSRTHSQ